jgi:hypothetical protein
VPGTTIVCFRGLCHCSWLSASCLGVAGLKDCCVTWAWYTGECGSPRLVPSSLDSDSRCLGWCHFWDILCSCGHTNLATCPGCTRGRCMSNVFSSIVDKTRSGSPVLPPLSDASADLLAPFDRDADLVVLSFLVPTKWVRQVSHTSREGPSLGLPCPRGQVASDGCPCFIDARLGAPFQGSLLGCDRNPTGMDLRDQNDEPDDARLRSLDPRPKYQSARETQNNDINNNQTMK